MRSADVVVVGLGAMGSAVAYQLARRGVRVIGLDRYSPPHSLGSSHGGSRIGRQAPVGGEDEECVPLANRSQEIWDEIRDQLGVKVINRCGALILADKRGPNASKLESIASAAVRQRIRHEVLSSAEIHERFPPFRITETHCGYFEPDGGFIRPEAAIQSQLKLARVHGAVVNFNEPVISVEPSGGSAKVTTPTETYEAAHVVVSAGPWMRDFVSVEAKDIFRPCRQVMFWYDVDHPRSFEPGRFPVFARYSDTDEGDGFYGFPVIDGTDGGMKVGTERPESWVTAADSVDRNVSLQESVEMYERHVRDSLVGVGPTTLRWSVCLYTVTPDRRFVIGPHPQQPQVFLVSPCSGRGFKFSAAIGEAVAQSITGERPCIDLARFGAERFA